MSIESAKCYYCDKVFSSKFTANEHMSYGHKELKDIYRSNFYKDVYSRIKNLESLLEEKDKIISSSAIRIIQLEERLSKIENYKSSSSS
jgi:hypothetical protein